MSHPTDRGIEAEPLPGSLLGLARGAHSLGSGWLACGPQRGEYRPSIRVEALSIQPVPGRAEDPFVVVKFDPFQQRDGYGLGVGVRVGASTTWNAPTSRGPRQAAAPA